MFHVEQMPKWATPELDPKWNAPGKPVILDPKNRKFSTEVRNYLGCHAASGGYRERLLSHVFAALGHFCSKEAFHSLAQFSTCQLATLQSPFPFNLDCHE
jgi:hypothetical protein